MILPVVIRFKRGQLRKGFDLLRAPCRLSLIEPCKVNRRLIGLSLALFGLNRCRRPGMKTLKGRESSVVNRKLIDQGEVRMAVRKLGAGLGWSSIPQETALVRLHLSSPSNWFGLIPGVADLQIDGSNDLLALHLKNR